MADLIKKIKIKKQDGTFTDYIPIGAEAQNISTQDGDSVQLKLNRKPYYYNSVADMKADTKLKAGDMAITLGYYEPNDGGGAEYVITSSKNENYYQILLNRNLYLTLINKDNINIRQLGAKGDSITDDSEVFNLAIELCKKNGYNTKIIVPDGKYVINNIKIKKYCHIEGSGIGNTFFIIKENCKKNAFEISDNDANFMQMSNFTILGNQTENSATEGILINRTSIEMGHDQYEIPYQANDLWLHLHDIRIIGINGNGISTGGTSSNFRESRIENVNINNCKGNGMYLQNETDNNFINITCWGNKKTGFYLGEGSGASRWINCKAFINGNNYDVEQKYYPGWFIKGSGLQIISCEAQENYADGFELSDCRESILQVRSDANGKSEKGSGNYTYSGIKINDSFIGNHLQINAECNDFIKSGGGEQSQGYGISFGIVTNSVIICNTLHNNEIYNLTDVGVLKKTKNNTIIINGNIISDILHSQYKNDSKIGSDYIFENNGGKLILSNYYNGEWKGNSIVNNITSDNNIKLTLLTKSTDILGFFGNYGSKRKKLPNNATDLDTAIILLNKLCDYLKSYGLFE